MADKNGQPDAAARSAGFNEFEAARDALAPAFAFGLQQALASPARWAELSRAFLAMAAPGNAGGAGNGTFLDAIFAAPGLKDAVLRQASNASGLAVPILAEMMPKIAALGTQALMRAAMGGFAPDAVATNRLPADAFGRITAEMMRRGANAVEALSSPAATTAPRPAADPFSPTYFLDAFGDAMRHAAAYAPLPAAPAGASAPFQPFAAMFAAFARGMESAAPASSERRPPSPAAAAPNPDLLGAFAEGNRRIQDSAMREMAALFERFAPAGGAR